MAKRRGRRSRLSMIPVAALQAELARRQGQLGSLMAEHSEVAQRLDAVRCAEIDALGGTVNGTGRRGTRAGARSGRRRRPRDESNLVDSLAKVLRGKEMSVTDAAEAVQKAGYKTTGKNFRTIVNAALINSGKFKRTGRGVYTAK